MKIHDVMDFPGVFQQQVLAYQILYFLYLHTEHETINIHEVIQGHIFPWGFLTILIGCLQIKYYKFADNVL